MTTQPTNSQQESADQTKEQTPSQTGFPKLVVPGETEYFREWKPAIAFDSDPARALEKANAVTLAPERVDTHTELLPVSEATRVVSAFNEFNHFSPDTVVQTLNLLHTLDPDLRVAVGLESSFVLYAYTKRADYAVQLLKIARADELHGNTEGGVFPKRLGDGFQWIDSWTTPPDGTEVLIRAWWD